MFYLLKHLPSGEVGRQETSQLAHAQTGAWAAALDPGTAVLTCHEGFPLEPQVLHGL